MPREVSRRSRLENERQVEIEAQNQRLLHRMMKISLEPNRGEQAANPERRGGRGGSLNIGIRRKEHSRIATENERFLKKLQNVKPTMSRSTWQKDRKKTEKYLSNIRTHKRADDERFTDHEGSCATFASRRSSSIGPTARLPRDPQYYPPDVLSLGGGMGMDVGMGMDGGDFGSFPSEKPVKKTRKRSASSTRTSRKSSGTGAPR